MSRFFRSVSDSESSGSSSSGSSDEGNGPTLAQTTTAKFNRAWSDSESDGNVKRVVKSGREKALDFMKECSKKIAVAQKKDDWVTASSEFSKMNKGQMKLKETPEFYLVTLARLQVAVDAAVGRRKSMDGLQGKAVSGLRQNLRKWNKDFDRELAKIRQRPDLMNADEESTSGDSSSSEESSSEEEAPKKKAPAKPATGRSKWLKAAESSSSSSESSSEEDTKKKAKKRGSKWTKRVSDSESSSSSESESEEEKKPKRVVKAKTGSGSSDWSEDESESDSSSSSSDGGQGLSGFQWWLKRDTTKEAKKKTKEKKERAQPVAAPATTQAQGEDGFTQVKARRHVTQQERDAQAASAAIADVTPEMVLSKLREVAEVRGKKGSERSTQIKILEKLLQVAVTPYQKIKVYLVYLSSQFDYSPAQMNHIEPEAWKVARSDLRDFMILLEQNPHLIVTEEATGEPVEDEDKLSLRDDFEEGETHRITGSVVSFIERLDDELNKILQETDPHTTEYIDRLKDETVLYELIVRGQAYSKRINNLSALSRVMVRRVEHLYFKPDAVNIAIEEAVSKDTGYPAVANITLLMKELCGTLYKAENERIRSRAVLCHLYHHALQNRFNDARDILLMTHLQETIHLADVGTQILYNRAMVQLGLCAFRCGLIKEAHSSLHDISSSHRNKELLAQGLMPQRISQLTPDQERAAKARLLPFHMHINLELIEAVYVLCSMLLEVPQIALHPHDNARRKVQSRIFRKFLEVSERLPFGGPPENTRDHILAASRALYIGDWKKCEELIMAIKVWDLFPDVEGVKRMMSKHIQEEGLRTYIAQAHPFHTSMSVQRLSEVFELSHSGVKTIVSKMILADEISASIVGPKGLITFRREADGEDRMNWLASQLAERSHTIGDSLERLTDHTSQLQFGGAGITVGGGMGRGQRGQRRRN